MSFGENLAELVENSGEPLLSKAASWERVKLGKVCQILNGFAWKSAYFSTVAGVPLIRIRDVMTGRTDTLYDGPITDGFWVDEGDLLVGMDGDFNIRRWSSGRGLLNQRVCRISPDETCYSAQFLEYILPPYLRLINRETSSVTVKHLSSRTLDEIPLPLPPLAEQRRIVMKLDALTTKLESVKAELERARGLALRIRAKILEQSFAQVGDDTRVMLDDITSRVTKGSSPRWQGFEYGASGIQFIRSQNIRWGYVSLEDQVYLPEEFNRKSKNSIIHANDVLLNIVGASIGRAAVASQDLAGANCNQAVAIIRPIDPDDATYIMYYLISPSAQGAISDGTVDVARANFSLSQIKSLRIPWPDKSTRGRLVDYIETQLERADRIGAEVSRGRSLLDQLESAVFIRAVRGELAARDPNDEPASALLERISLGHEALPERKISRQASRKTNRGIPITRGGILGKKRSEVAKNYLRDVLAQLGGVAAAKQLWSRSEMDIDEFYKQLRDEMKAGLIREGATKGELELVDAA